MAIGFSVEGAFGHFDSSFTSQPLAPFLRALAAERGGSLAGFSFAASPSFAAPQASFDWADGPLLRGRGADDRKGEEEDGGGSSGSGSGSDLSDGDDQGGGEGDDDAGSQSEFYDYDDEFEVGEATDADGSGRSTAVNAVRTEGGTVLPWAL